VLLGSGHTCPRLRHITLPQAKITWEQLEALLKVAPCLESLYVFRLTPPKPSLTSSSSTSSLIRLRAGASAHREHVVERKENTAGEGGCQRLGVLHSLVVVMLHLEDLIRMPEAFTQVGASAGCRGIALYAHHCNLYITSASGCVALACPLGAPGWCTQHCSGSPCCLS
jgi:hypothetical protein